MRTVVKAVCLAFVALFLCVALATPSFAGEIHWYNWSDGLGLSFKDFCSNGKKGMGLLWSVDVVEIKELVYRWAAEGQALPLHAGFDCLESVFSLKDKDLLMAHALLRFRDNPLTLVLFGDNAYALITERANLLESQYFGIPGGL